MDRPSSTRRMSRILLFSLLATVVALSGVAGGGAAVVNAEPRPRDSAAKPPQPIAAATPAADASIASVLGTAIQVSTGWRHACALMPGGAVKCWGDNRGGQLGDGTTTGRSTPVDVVGLASGVAAVSAGEGHTCAVTSSSGVKCWGANWAGQVGDGTQTDRSTPVDVVGLTSGVSEVSTGNEHSCALTSSGGVKCWGDNRGGELGDGTTTQRLTPVDVVGLASGVAAISATGWDHTCALMDASHGGGVKCWGNNERGELGDGTTTDRWTPVGVVGLTSGVASVSAGGLSTCALMDAAHGGGVKCWGDNRAGELGDGTTTDHWTPTDVVGLGSGVTAAAIGLDHACALTAGGGAKCWGANPNGELGDGTRTQRHTPVDVVGLSSGVRTVNPGHEHSCALTAAGGVKCWGWNVWGQVGDGSTTDRLTPVEVVGLSPKFFAYLPILSRSFDLSLADNFSDPNSGWPAWDNEDSTAGYLGGEYRILVKQQDSVAHAGRQELVSDFALQVDARAVGNLDGNHGIYFGYGNGSYYFFRISGGRYALDRRDGLTGAWATIIPWMHAAQVLGGKQTNHLKVTKAGSQLSLYANGQLLAQRFDLAVRAGGVGLAAASVSPDYEARFDNFRMEYTLAAR